MSYAVEGLSLALVALALALSRSRDLFASVALLSAFSGFAAVLYTVLGAVDVAFTEVVVGGGVSTVLLIALIRRVDAPTLRRRPRLSRAVAVACALALFVALLLGIAALPPFGEAAPAARGHVAAVYVERAVRDTRSPNIVTAVLADYRGFDTLIETAVILAAALACRSILARDDP
jgi:multicomponent Na+:H+ antiporter subunit B